MRRSRAVACVITVGIVLGALAGVLADRFGTREYEATAFVVTSADDVISDPSSVFQSSYGVWRIPEYEAIVRSESFLTRVVADKRLGVSPDELAERIHTGTAAKKSAVLTISAVDGSALIAAALANSVAEALAEVIGEREHSVDVRATVAAAAVPPQHSNSPPLSLVVAQPAVAGAVIAWALIVPIVRSRRTHRGTRTS
ncbi:hypothetical protein FK529_17945 [Tsukamurella asaccharolytica]|uniref:Lipopolysaccharide biosynthesis protein n=1 Tax=Tsukamurella asaccharolytica TaxID=2592067 RepID=A0A5C5R5A5_9ACTN|nr:hypothetical protein [Tsukamurella asaccharolytica]TWS17968.1 hypothetical protein FK529_17945 [Tsukamurella asaccharolytica]